FPDCSTEQPGIAHHLLRWNQQCPGTRQRPKDSGDGAIEAERREQQKPTRLAVYIPSRPSRRHQILVRDHHAFGFARRSRGINDVGQILWPEPQLQRNWIVYRFGIKLMSLRI